MLNMLKKTALHGLRAIAVAIALGAASTAGALTLADLNAGASFTSLDGTLTFQNFNVSVPATIGSSSNAFLGLDLSLIEVEALPTTGFGFRVIEFDAPLVAVGEEVGQLVIGFEAVATPTYVITGANLRFTGTAIGNGAIARIDESVVAPAGTTNLHVIRQGSGLQHPEDHNSLAMPANSVDVTATITLDTRGRTAFLAQLSEFEPGFSARPVPEPGAAAVFGGSLLLVATASRRRWL
jgi:hypothetical protein